MNTMRPPRFDSVDALRGLTVAAMLLVNNPGDWGHVYAPLQHAAWHGATPTDLIFPMFLCIVGVSTSLALAPRIANGSPRGALFRTVTIRALRIIALGLVLHLCAWLLLDQPHYRPWGVLQRIGLCFLAAGAAALWLKPVWQWLLCGVLLLGSGVLLALGGTLDPWTNIFSRIDTALFAPWLYQWDPATGLGHDPEGLPSTFAAIATTLFGVRAGAWLRDGRLARIAWIGAAAVCAGWLATFSLPWNKHLWTPSYAVWSAGIALLALALAHVAIDRRGWPALGRRFGVNAIAVYGGSALMVYVLAALGWWQAIYDSVFVAWVAPTFGPHAASLAFALAFVGTWWCVAWLLDRKNIYLKI